MLRFLIRHHLLHRPTQTQTLTQMVNLRDLIWLTLLTP